MRTARSFPALPIGLWPSASSFLPSAFVLAQQPQFRAGTDLVAVDFQVVDENGQPVTDLKSAELTLKVDGRTRDIRALQFVKVARTSGDSPAAVVASLPLPFASNDAITPGRIVIIVVDHEHLRPGEGKAAIDAAGRLVDRLSPTDRIGLVTLPYGSVEVDLTTNHARVLSGSGDNIFTRIADEVSAYYLLGFEPGARERDGKRHKIELTTKRQRVLIRARPGFIIDEPDRTARPLGPTAILRDFAVHRDLQLRAAAFPFRNADKENVKVVVAVEPADSATTLNAAAFAMINTKGQVVAEWTEEGAAVIVRPLVTAAVVPPGDYRLRVAAVDTTGRRGAVDYEFAAALTPADPLRLGTLMAGVAERGNFRPRLQFDLTATPSATGYAEIYGTPPAGATLTATLELAIAPNAQPLASAPANVLQSTDPDRRVATGDLEIKSVTPGDYVLRLVVKLDERVIGQATRVIRIVGRT